jgi:hypothetical protein
MKIRITESQFKEMVARTMNESLEEWQKVLGPFPKGYVDKKGENWKQEMIRREAEKSPKLDPNGFRWFGDELRHNEKPRPKSAPKPKKPIISKPDGMSSEEYERTLVIPNNPKYREKLEEYPDEEFRPIVNGGRYFGGTADFGCDYEVSNRARLKVVNHSNAIKSDIYRPYPAPGKKAMQFTMVGSGEEGERLRTTPSVAYMVANAFLGEHDPSQWLVKHKDGDWRNNNVENLEWVPAKVTGRFGKVAESVDEISYDTLSSAKDKIGDGWCSSALDAVEELREFLNRAEGSFHRAHGQEALNYFYDNKKAPNQGVAAKCQEYLDFIENFIRRKEAQCYNFDSGMVDKRESNDAELLQYAKKWNGYNGNSIEEFAKSLSNEYDDNWEDEWDRFLKSIDDPELREYARYNV